MAIEYVRTDDPRSLHTSTRTRLLEKVLSHHAADDLDVIELRRHMGKSGYVPTPHRWELDDDDFTDDDGSVLLICGTPPGDLAGEIVQTARRHVEETGERKNHRVVGLRRVMDDDGEEGGEEASFQFLLPGSLLGAEDQEPGTGSESREHHDALMAAKLRGVGTTPTSDVAPG